MTDSCWMDGDIMEVEVHTLSCLLEVEIITQHCMGGWMVVPR